MKKRTNQRTKKCKFPHCRLNKDLMKLGITVERDQRSGKEVKKKIEHKQDRTDGQTDGKMEGRAEVVNISPSLHRSGTACYTSRGQLLD